MLDYYRILKTPRGAAQAELKKAYIERLKQYHPDIYKGKDATAKTQKINEAYAVLKNPQKRAAYDRDLRAVYHQTASGGDGGGADSAYSSADSYSSAPPHGAAEILAFIRADIQERRNFIILHLQNNLQNLMQQSLALLQLGADFNSVRTAAERDYRQFTSGLAEENSAYYRQFSRSSANLRLNLEIAEISRAQQQFIDILTAETWPSFMEELARQAQASGRAAGAPFAQAEDMMRPAGFFSRAFWGGLALAAVFPALILISAAVYIFGRKTPAKKQFLAGSVLGFILHNLFIAV